MTTPKLIKTAAIECDESLYVRSMVSWKVVLKYAEAMEAGAVFPPVVVARAGKKYVLVDGWHRLQATERRNEEYISVEVLKTLSHDQIYVEGVKRNIAHGQSLSVKERTNAIIKFEEMGMSVIEISNIILIPPERIKPFVSKRMVNILGTDETTGIKPSLKHLAGQTIKDPDIDALLGGDTQLRLITQLIYIIENNLLDDSDKDIRDRLILLGALIQKLDLGIKVTE